MNIRTNIARFSDKSREIKHRVVRHVAKSRLVKRTLSFLTQWIEEIQLGGVLVFCVVLQSFGSASIINGTDRLIYPTPRVSTLECRTQQRDSMPASCKIDLPIMQGALYANYRHQKSYTDIYTTLWGATYEDGRDIAKGGHPSVDIATANGTPVLSIADGEILFAGWQNLYGNVIKVKHTYRGETIYSIYAHLSEIKVKQGDRIKQGQLIGKVGNTGLVFGQLGGYHLNFEIVKDAKGRPTRSFSGCADSRKDRVRLVNEGACRTQMEKNSYDPIALIEGKPTKLVQVLGRGAATAPAITDRTPSVPPSTNVPNNSPTNPPVLTPSTPANTTAPSSTTADQYIDSAAVNLGGGMSLIVSTPSAGLRIPTGSTRTFFVKINQTDAKPFEGILKKPLQIVSATKGIRSSISSLQRVSKGSAQVQVTGVSAGTHSLTLMYQGKAVSTLKIIVE